MSDNNLHIQFKRQIPEHVRTAYPKFVEFLKAYQEFLTQTQSQELEKFRDIDTVTDEFVERFKAELAYNFTLDDVQDKRMFLKNLREFYLSRGSEASYKFIFRTLFDKDVEISYPSRQMLRVSDGKWKQDVSIFVQNTSPNVNDLFALSGNYITITSGRKTLTTYVENVVQYSDNIFEVFIQRDVVKSIAVGSTISFSDDTIEYSGNILLTPKSIKILKPGRGFKIGSVFNLRTNLGDGCKIKVTQVDGNGGIVRAKILKFALDYTSDFWSYLHAKQTEESPTLGFFKTENDQFLNTNNFLSENIIESGFISKQTYMFYDTTIPTDQSAGGGNRFFADTSYVGDVYTQFYSNNPLDVATEDFAQILVEVGACSIYSGYYLAQDGFISDEIYIQDSNYYQAFSYVIKVEEELRKYADLVKAILHPAGMKMFAEFQILNRINISATTIIKDRVIQISDLLDGIIDRGIGYTGYDVTFDENGDFIHTPKEGAGIILGPIGRPVYILGKKQSSQFTLDTTVIEKLFTKVIGIGDTSLENSFIVDQTSFTKDFIKELLETIIPNVVIEKIVDKTVNSLIDIVSTITKDFAKNLGNEFSISSEIAKSFIKELSSEINHTLVVNKHFTKSVSSSVSVPLTNFIKSVTKSLESVIQHQSLPLLSFTKILSSAIDSFQSEVSLGLNKTLSSQLNTPTSILTDKPFIKGLIEDIIIQDPFSNNITKGGTTGNLDPLFNDSFQLLSEIQYFIFLLREEEDFINLTESIVDQITKNIPETQTILSTYGNSINKGGTTGNLDPLFDDSFVLSSVIDYIIGAIRDEQSFIDLTESIVDQITKNILETQLISSLYVGITNKNISNSVNTVSSTSNQFAKTPINNSIVLAENIDSFTNKNLSLTQSISSLYVDVVGKNISNSVNTVSSPSNQFAKAPINNSITLAENINNLTDKNLSSTILTSSVLARANLKEIQLEAITDDSGILKINSYDSNLEYFSPNALDYQDNVISIT